MKRKRFSDEQIIGILSEAAAGATAVEVCRRHGVSETTFYRWKGKGGGLAVSDAGRLRRLEAENTRLKRLRADAHLDNAALKDLLAKMYGPPRLARLKRFRRGDEQIRAFPRPSPMSTRFWQATWIVFGLRFNCFTIAGVKQG